MHIYTHYDGYSYIYRLNMMNQNYKFLIEAHRGVSCDYPENTLAAFRAAVELGYDMIELDPKFTADLECVILHDRSINRTARLPNGEAISRELKIAEIGLAEARLYDYGLFMGERFRGEAIPTLGDALSFSAAYNIPLKLDNVIESFDEDQLDILFDTVERMDERKLTGFTCKSVKFMRIVTSKFPNHAIHYDGPLSEAALKEVKAALRENELTIWIHIDAITEELAALIKSYGKLGIWILTAHEQLDRAAAFSPDIIETEGSAFK